MTKLKDVLEGLVADSNLSERVERYKAIHKQLINDENIESLKRMIRRLYEFVYAGSGRELGGLDACELCSPAHIPH